MTEQRVSIEAEATAVYEVRLRGTSIEPLARHFPSATVTTTRAETVLLREVQHPGELDVLIDHLLSMGLVLTEVHRVESPTAVPGTAGASMAGGSR